MTSCENPILQSPLNVSSRDKFIMLLDLPYVLKQKEPKFPLEPLRISIHGIVAPEVSVPDVSLRYQGQNMFVSSHSRPNYSSLSVNFVVDNQYNNYYYLWRWLDILNLSIENKYGGSIDEPDLRQALEIGDQFEYQTTVRVLALNEYNQTSLEFVYTKAFITKLGGINYSYREGSSLESTAEFSFSQMSVDRTATI